MKKLKLPYKLFGLTALLLLVGGVVAGLNLIGREQTYQPKAVDFNIATLGDYWNGQAEWKLEKKYSQESTGWPYGFAAGANIHIVNGIWYWFHWQYSGITPSYCNGLQKAGMFARRSTDRGQTWSGQVAIIPPDEGTAWECYATDGDTYYNSSEAKWHYVFQCLDRNIRWNVCHLTREGSDPLGAFQQTHANPVLRGGSEHRDLWKDIMPGVTDAGTFQIFDYKDGYYFTSFHGVNVDPYGSGGYRGIAKTRDFITWVAGDPNQGVPADSVLTRNDALTWRENWNGSPGGIGAGGILHDGGYYYQVAEGSDPDLSCIDGQNWDVGIFRSNSITNTNWEQYPLGNPILYSSKKPERGGKSIGCNPAYTRLFRDDATGAIYMHTSRESTDLNYSGVYVYRLEKTGNLLQNADLWKCRADNWDRTSSGQTTNIVVLRYPNESTDGNCFLATNCGGNSCVGEQTIFQDIDLSGYGGRSLVFGGKIGTEKGHGLGSGILMVLQMDFSGNIITRQEVAVLTSDYQDFAGQFAVDPRTTKLRFQFKLTSPQTFNLDELYVKEGGNATPPASGRPGDINQDSKISMLDVGIIIENFDKQPLLDSRADINKDGKVSMLDLGVVIEGFDR